MKKSIGKEQMFRIPYTFFHIRVIIFSDFKYAKSIRKRKSHDMKEQGHSQSLRCLLMKAAPKAVLLSNYTANTSPPATNPRPL